MAGQGQYLRKWQVREVRAVVSAYGLRESVEPPGAPAVRSAEIQSR
jgi:hypothetical protein